MIYFETERLIFRDWSKSDIKVFELINSDDRVMEFFPKKLTSQETLNFYNKIMKEFDENKYGLYAVEVKSTNEFVGFIGFHNADFNSDFTPCVEIGWRLKYDLWGYGYATEGAKACINYAFESLSFDEIYSFTAKINVASINVMKKIGLKFIKTFDYPTINKSSNLCGHVLYKISKYNK